MGAPISTGAPIMGGISMGAPISTGAPIMGGISIGAPISMGAPISGPVVQTSTPFLPSQPQIFDQATIEVPINNDVEP